MSDKKESLEQAATRAAQDVYLSNWDQEADPEIVLAYMNGDMALPRLDAGEHYDIEVWLPFAERPLADIAKLVALLRDDFIDFVNRQTTKHTC